MRQRSVDNNLQGHYGDLINDAQVVRRDWTIYPTRRGSYGCTVVLGASEM